MVVRGMQDHTCPLDGSSALQPAQPPQTLEKGERSGLGGGVSSPAGHLWSAAMKGPASISFDSQWPFSLSLSLSR